MSGHIDLDPTSLIAGWYVDFYLADFISGGDPDLCGACGLDDDFVGPAVGIVEGFPEGGCAVGFIVAGLDEHSLFAPLVVAGLDEHALGAGLVVSGNPAAGSGAAKDLSQINVQGQAMVRTPGRLFPTGSSRSGPG